MSIDMMNAKAATYFDLMEQIEQLQAEVEAIKDALKGQMVERDTEELEGAEWQSTWHNTSNSRFDTKRFKADHADLYGQYTVKSTGTRFTLPCTNTGQSLMEETPTKPQLLFPLAQVVGGRC